STAIALMPIAKRAPNKAARLDEYIYILGSREYRATGLSTILDGLALLRQAFLRKKIAHNRSRRLPVTNKTVKVAKLAPFFTFFLKIDLSFHIHHFTLVEGN